MSETNVLQLIESVAKSNGLDFDTKPVSTLTNTAVQLAISPSEKQSIANMFPADSSARYMAMTFTNKLPNLLNTLHNSNATLMVRDEFGHFVKGIAVGDLFEVILTANTLTLMALASQQVLLSQIDSKLNLINKKLDDILQFLYGNKKAELLAEISFSKYAYENFVSISKHAEQRQATITSLQEGKKIALKDIEFYISDLDYAVKTDPKMVADAEKNAEKCLQICDSIDLSIQLYTLNCLLEVYYSQNTDAEYISYIEDDIRQYLDKCDKRMLSDLSKLQEHIKGGKIALPGRGKVDSSILKLVNQRHDDLNSHLIGDKQKELLDALHAIGQKSTYLITSNGDVFLEQ